MESADLRLTYMDSDLTLTAPQSPIEPMDFLSRDWANSTREVFCPVTKDGAIVCQEYRTTTSTVDVKAPLPKMDRSTKVDVPPWKGNDVKSWIWLQQAMHPEVNYNNCFRKKWFSWKMSPFKNIPIKKWFKEMKQKRKEEDRLQRAELHAAISVAGVAAALAAVAAENSKNNQFNNNNKEGVVASAAALVASQCAKVAESMGAKREQLSTVIGSAMTSASATEILTLTAAAATSLRGAATLRGRPGRRDVLNGSTPVMPIEDDKEIDFDFDKFRAMLAKGADLGIEKPDGKYAYRSVSVILNREAKVILKTRKINTLAAFASSKECVVLDLHAELYSDPSSAEGTSYYIVLTTNRGMIKLDMEDDFEHYKMWAETINHMLMLSASFTGYELQFY